MVVVVGRGSRRPDLSGAASCTPRGGNGVGDPFVQVSATGSPQLVLISQNSFDSNKLKTLSKGTLWSSLGVTCNIRSARSCASTLTITGS